MATSEYRGLMGAGFPQGYPGSFGPLIRYGSPDGFTGGVAVPGMNTQPYYKPNPLGMPGEEEEPPYDNQGMRNASWDDFKNKDAREALRKNPYGNISNKEGGGRTWTDWVRKEGRDFADPESMNDFMKLLAGYRSAYNPNGKQSPYHKGTQVNPYTGVGGNGYGGFLQSMTAAEKRRYSRARYTYDNGLRDGLSDENSYEMKRNREAEKPGSTAKLRPWQGGVWERDGTLEVPDAFKLPGGA